MPAPKKNILVKYLLNREHGTLSFSESCALANSDGQAVAEEKSTIPVINKACELSGHSRSTFLVSFSPDRTKIASTHGDHTVRVTELKTGKCSHILRGHPRTPWSIAFHPSSNEILATGCLGGEVRIWDLRGGGTEIWKSEQGRVIASLAFHPTDQVLVIATNNELLFWDWSKPEPFARCKTASDYEKVRWCKFDPFGHYLYTGIANKSTIQSDEFDNFSMVYLGSDPPETQDRSAMQENYGRIVNEIGRQQRDRLNAHRSSHDLEILEPPSPSHAEAVSDARSYAEHVTRQNYQQRQRQLEHARQYAASVTRSRHHTNNPHPGSSSGGGSGPRIEIGRVEGPSAPDLDDTEDHMQQIHRIPNVYAPSSRSSSLETLAQAAAVVSHMDTTPPPTLSDRPRMRDLHASLSQPRLSTRHRPPPPPRISTTSSIAATPPPGSSSSSLSIIQSSITETQSVFQRMMSRLGRSAMQTTTSHLNSESQVESNSLPAAAVMPRSSTFDSSSTESTESQDFTNTVPVVISHFYGTEEEEPDMMVSRTLDGTENATGIDSDLPDTSPPPNVTTTEENRTTQDSVNNNNALSLGSANNLWQAFEGGSLNIEIPNMTPNSDDSNSFSGPMRTPRNSTDVDRPPQPIPGNGGGPLGLIQPLSSLTSNVSSPTVVNYGYSSSRSGIGSDVIPNPLSIYRANSVSASNNSTLFTQQRAITRTSSLSFSNNNNDDNNNSSSINREINLNQDNYNNQNVSRNLSDLSGSHVGGLQGNNNNSRDTNSSVSMPSPSSALSSHLMSHLSRSNNSSVSSSSAARLLTRPPSLTPTVAATTSSAIPSSTNTSSSLFPPNSISNTGSNSSNRSSELNIRLGRLFPVSSVPLSLDSSPSSSVQVAPQRGRNLMRLLETPFSTTNAQPSITVSERSTSVPQPVPPVTQTPLFQGRNREIRSSLSQQQRLTNSNNDHNYFSSNLSITRNPGLSLSGHSVSEACPDGCQICGNTGLPSSGGFLSRYGPNRMARPSVYARHSNRQIRSLRDTQIFGNNRGEGTGASLPTTPTSREGLPHVDSPTVSSRANSNSASSPSSRQQPQRLATIIESEVREAINRIQSRRLNITETIRDLNHLQRDLADIPVEATGQGGASSSDPPSIQPSVDVPATVEITTAAEDIPIDSVEVTTRTTVRSNSEQGSTVEPSAVVQTSYSPSTPTTSSSPPSNASNAARNRVRNNPAGSTANNAGLASEQGSESWDNGSSSEHSNDSGGFLSISQTMSHDLDERIERLDQRVSDIQRRLRERMQRMEHSYSGSSRRSSQYQSVSQRMQERRQRMQRHLESLRRRNQERERRIRRFGTSYNREGSSPNLRLPAEEEGDPTQSASRLRNLHDEIRNVRQELARRRERERRHWHTLHRRHLHPDYSQSIIEETINRENDFQAAINRTIAGAFMANGEASIASNIVNLTHRIQRWDMSLGEIPDISDPAVNVVIPCCKLHNDATADISQDGKLLAIFVPSHRGFPDDTVLGVFSLEEPDVGKCLYTKSFGPNAISVSLSPLNNYVLVGLAAKRLQWVFAPKQMVAQIYKLSEQEAGEDSMEHICDLMHPCDLDLRVHVSVNSARWLPGVGEGVVYCTNRGDLHICKPGWEKNSAPLSSSSSDNPEERQQSFTRQLVMQLLRINSPRTNNSATQTTTQGVRRSASTQTDTVNMSSDTDSD